VVLVVAAFLVGRARRLRELERQSKLADTRLARAKAGQGQLAPDGTSGIGGRGG
jgi:hypothetical protein